MKPVLVHIGYHKTATTWLQKEIFNQESEVFENLTTYAPNTNPHSSFARTFIYNDEGYLLSSFADNKEGIQKELRRIQNLPGKDFKNKIPVITHERLSGNPGASGFDARLIAERIKNAFPNAKILIGIREQKSVLRSMYFQYINSGTHSLKKYLTTKYDGNRPTFSPEHFDYLPLVLHYQKLFGKENVLVLPYELFAKKPIEYLEKLGEFIGEKIPMNPERFKIRQNQKKFHFTNYYLRGLNIFIFKSSLNNYSPWCNYVTRRIAYGIKLGIGILTPRFLNKWIIKKSDKLIQNFVDLRYNKSNKKLSKTLGINLAKYGYH